MVVDAALAQTLRIVGHLQIAPIHVPNNASFEPEHHDMPCMPCVKKHSVSGVPYPMQSWSKDTLGEGTRSLEVRGPLRLAEVNSRSRGGFLSYTQASRASRSRVTVRKPRAGKRDTVGVLRVRQGNPTTWHGACGTHAGRAESSDGESLSPSPLSPLEWDRLTERRLQVPSCHCWTHIGDVRHS